MNSAKKSAEHSFASTLKTFKTPSGKSGSYFSLPELAKKFPNVNKLPISMRIVLESVLRNCDGKKVTPEHVERLANWQPTAERVDEIPFVVARVVLQDFTGVPLLADLAAMRNVAVSMGKNPRTIEPLVPVDLVVDHSVMIDHYGTKNALDLNMKLEFERNNERYEFMKWGMQAFETFGVVPPGFGIVHQVNLEYLARGVHSKGGVYYPDSLVGTDSHTTMINGIGVVAWGVGGIEAEAGMLGQPVYFLTPDVVGFELTGQLREGVTATDLVLTVTEILRREKGGGQVRRILRRRHQHALAAGPRDHRQHGARIRRDHGLLPGRRKNHRLLRGHRPHQGRDRGLRELLQGAEDVWRAQVGRHPFFEGSLARPLHRHALSCRPQAPARPHRAGQDAQRIHRALQQAHRGQRLQPAAREAAPGLQDRERPRGEERRRADRRHHLVHQHLEPGRAAGRRPAGQEGGRVGPQGGAAHQDLARARLARGHRIPRQGRPLTLPRQTRLQPGRLRLHHLHRQCGRPHRRAQ